MSEIVSLIYASKVVPGFQDSVEIDKILTQARINNKTSNITGMLLCNLHYFLQTLEGPRDTLTSLYQTIAADPRHEAVTKISETSLSKRRFGDWKMGFYLFHDAEEVPRDWTQLTPQQANSIFKSAVSLSKDNPSRGYYSLS